jgi:hypothetical protein
MANTKKYSMGAMRALVVAAVGLLLSVPASAQDLSHYRDYVLGSSLDSIVAASRARRTDAKTLYERPAKIQELEWRAPYVSTGTELADPVREIAFTFYNDALYQIVVRYDRGRTEGLTDRDIIESLSTVYGVPALSSPKTRATPATTTGAETVELARWQNVDASVSLLRDAYSPEFQLVLISKSTSTHARSAISEAIRLDAVDAPRRESEQRKKEVADGIVAREKMRATNKAAFRP